MSTPCPIAGNPDLYGLGIRVSFYLIWISILCLNPIEERYIVILYVGELVLDAAVLLGLVIAASGGYLHAVEVYIAILLLSTTFYLFFPRHLADLAMVVCPHLGLRVKKRIDENYVAAFRCLYAIVIIALQLWFWISGVDDSHIHRMLKDGDETKCQQFGFLFGRIDLHNSALKAMHIIVLILAVGAGILIEYKFYQSRVKQRRRRKIRSRWTIQKWTEAIGGLAVVTTLIVAIELTIKWNQIPAVVNQATTAAQLIPLLLVVALLVLFLYAYSRAVCYRYDSSSDSDNDITLSIAGSPSGGGSSSSSGGSDPEPLVVVVKRGSRSRSRSGPDIIRISHPSPTHRSPRSRRNTQPRPRGPRSPPERSRPSHPRTPSPNPQGSQSRGPRVIDVHPPPRPPSSSSSSSSSRFGPRVSGYRYPPHYPFPHIFRRQPFQPPARSLRRRGAAATTTTTPGGAHPWDHMLFASDPDQLPWVRHPQAATAVERYRVSTFSAATPEAAEATGTDIKEAPTDCDPKMKEEHDKMWEETFHPQDLISEEDLKECMADLPGLYTDADVKACLDKTDGVHISSADAADWLKKQEYYKQEDADKMVREGGHYTQQQADDIVREELYEQKDADDLVNGNDLYTEEDVEEVMNPKPQARIPQPTGEEGGESSRMAKARVRGMPVDFVSNASSDA